MKLSVYLFGLVFTLVCHARPTLTRAQEGEVKNFLTQNWKGPSKFTDDLFKGEVISQGEARSERDQQTLMTQVIGIHPRTCQKGLRKISLYEQYSKHMSFIKESSYDDSLQRVNFLIDHTLLPFPMQLRFKIPRITGPGEYDFLFPDGIFKGLVGKIRVQSLGARCLYFMEVNWKGQTTKIPDVAVGAFAQTLSKLGLEHLIRVSEL